MFSLAKKTREEWFRVFEYGSGGSTLWFAERVTELVLVEHDSAWYGQVTKSVRLFTNSKIWLRVPSQTISGFEPARSLTFEEYREFNFKEYVESIHNFPDNYFDIVFIDGRAREACLRAETNVGVFLLKLIPL